MVLSIDINVMHSRLPRPPLAVWPAVAEVRGRARPRPTDPDDDLYIVFHRWSVALGYTVPTTDLQHTDDVWHVAEAEMSQDDTGLATAFIQLTVPDSSPPGAFVSSFVHCAGLALTELADWDVESLSLHLPVYVCNAALPVTATARSLLRPGTNHRGAVTVSGDVPTDAVAAGLQGLADVPVAGATGWLPAGDRATFSLDRWDLDQLGIIANLVCQHIDPAACTAPPGAAMSVSITRGACD